jgi:hypothetical protein
VALALAAVSLAQNVHTECVNLTWTASGDDGYVGQAAFYDIRYSKAFITDFTWLGNSRVTRVPVPKTAGQSEQFTVCGLEPQQAYYFAIRAADENFNWSSLSNVVLKFTEGSVGLRGDINHNSISYEVGDAVMFMNFFLQGLAVFTENFDEQIEATDVNADGIRLSVADLTYLIRVLVGDAPALLKTNPYADNLQVQSEQTSEGLRIVTTTVSTIGAAFLRFTLDPGVTVEDVVPGTAAEGMNLDYRVNGDTLNVIVYDIGRDRIEAGRQHLMTISTSSRGAIRAIEAQVADYDGQPYTAAFTNGALPSGFELHQNYPNPFNPATSIEFSLPTASRVSLEVFNVLGERVALLLDGSVEAGVHRVEWDGRNLAGQSVSSGVYFYRLQSDGISETKKMLLLK